MCLSYLWQVHSSENGKNFRSKLQSEHIELLQSPWLIELGAFCLNLNGSDDRELHEISGQFSCDLNAIPPVMKMPLPDSRNLDYDLTCAICLVRSYFWSCKQTKKTTFFFSMLVPDMSLVIVQDTVFNPYALTCGHLFCKSCACSAASVLIFQGLKYASQEAKCPICREVCIYLI